MLNEYQSLAMRTSQWCPGHPEYRSRRHMLYGAFTIAGESGEVVDALKKEVFSAHPADREKIKREFGDVCWGVACLCEVFDLRFELVVDRASRYRGLSRWRAWDIEDTSLTLSCAAGVVARMVRDNVGIGFDRDDMNRELAGVMAPLWTLAELLGFTLEDVLSANIEKLAARYPSGSYSHSDSIARVDTIDEGAPTSSMRAVATVEKKGVSTRPEATK